MKILVLGGTGAMGKPIVDILSERGYQVFVTSRKERESCNANVTYIQGNALQYTFVSELLKEKFDAIIDFMKYSLEDFEIHSKLFLQNTQQYVFLSSARVYADANDVMLTEEHPRLLDVCDDKTYLLTNEYALEKAREEDILVKGQFQNYTIIRPYITYNDERLQLGILEKEAWLFRALRGKTIVFSADIARKMTTLTYGYDVAYKIADLIGNQNSLGEIYHIVTNKSIQWSEVLEIYLDTIEGCIGKRPSVNMLEECDFYSRKLVPYQLNYDRLYNRHFSNMKIVKETGNAKTFMLPQDGLKMCLENFINNEKKFRGINWRREAIFDRITGEREKIRTIPGIKNKVKYVLYRYFLI